MAPHVILSARRRLTEYLKRNARTAAGGSLLCGEGRKVLQRQRIRTHLRLEIGSDSFSLVWMFITILCQIKKSECPYEHSDWCARRDLNPYVINTRPSNVPVCQFQHSRPASVIIAVGAALVKGFLQKNQPFTETAFSSPIVSARRICTGASAVYGLQCGRPSPFGLPQRAKFAQYPDTAASSA